jgi:hypothetical protein
MSSLSKSFSFRFVGCFGDSWNELISGRLVMKINRTMRDIGQRQGENG